MKNQEISLEFRNIAKILEIKGENLFRIRAYERAAQNIDSLTENIQKFADEDKLEEIPGIGKDLAQKIKEFLKTGKIKAFGEIKKSMPSGLLELVNIPTVGPKTAKLFYEKLKVKSILELEEAIEKNKLTGVFGIKEKTIANISEGIEQIKKGKERMTLFQAMLASYGFLKDLRAIKHVKAVSAAGSLRRQKETVRDIDILVASDEPEKVMEAFTTLDPVKKIIAKGPTKSSVLTLNNVQLDCRVVEERSFGAALIYFTGSKDFNIKLRQLALKAGLKINEYGVFRNEKFICGKTEEEVFKILGLSFIVPELRENTGEIELAAKNALPELLELKDIKGDLHVHSRWSDGTNTIEDIAQYCINKGYKYVAVTDHSQGLKIAGGLNLADLKKKKVEIDRLNKKFRDFRILFGTEVDITVDGRLDYKDDVLREFDVVIVAIHTGFKESSAQLTKRIICACKNKYAHIIAHPTGKLWGSREAYEIDFNEILKAAKDTHTHFEINSFPTRMDLDSQHSRAAKEKGVKLAINTDSHANEQLDSMKIGIAVARRGWLSASDVLNTLPVEQLLGELKK